MATILKRGNRYQAQINRNGIRKSQSFLTKNDAEKWARKIESEIERSIYIDTSSSKRPFSELLDLYEAEIVPRLKSHYVEKYRIKWLRRKMGMILISKITPEVIRKLRDQRLKEVKPGTVRKDLGLISRVLNTGEKDFGFMLPNGNPVSKIRMPIVRDERERRLTSEEAEIIEQIPVFSFAIQTAMRRGEIHNMDWSHIDLASSELWIPETKTGKPRTIPLTKKAVDILKSLRKGKVTPMSGKVWDFSKDFMSRSFMRLCRNNGFEDLRLHDLRHEGTSRFFEIGLNPVEVASITGHTDTRTLMRYTHLQSNYLVDKIKLLSENN